MWAAFFIALAINRPVDTRRNYATRLSATGFSDFRPKPNFTANSDRWGLKYASPERVIVCLGDR